MKTETENLDEWTAVNVMGYIPCAGDFWDGAVCPGKFNCEPSKATSWAFEYPGGVMVGGKAYCSTARYKWSPTTDPAAAMQVLEKCTGETSVAIRKQSDGSFCIWWTESENMRERSVFGGTLPMAICRFAKQLFSK